VAIDGRIAGAVRLAGSDRSAAVDRLEALGGAYELWLLSGDRASSAPGWVSLFGDRARFQQTPEQKLAVIDARRASGARVLMVGDGLNDAGAFAAADVGLAVSDDTACLVPACDAIVRGDRLSKLPEFLAYARRGRQTLVACFTVSLAYNAVGLTLALGGHLTPLATAVLMPVSSITIIGLAAGLMRWRTRKVLA
jgi:Cu+-exporting ATPase